MDVTGGIAAVTLIVEDLAATRRFYERVFEVEAVFEDEDSVVFRFGGTLLNLLRIEAAPELIRPARAGDGDGVRAVHTLAVDDVDAECARLADLGVELLNGPTTRPWGPRTASFRDPAGTVWEIAR